MKKSFFGKIKEINERTRKKSLDYSIKDANAYSVMAGFGEEYITPFAIAMRATTQQIGFLASVPRLAGSVLQIYAAEVTDRWKNRKRIINTSVFLQAIIWLPILLIPFLMWKNDILLLTIFVSLYWIFGQFAGPAWSSLMGDLVKNEERGIYFGKRNRVSGFIGFVSIFIAGVTLDIFSDFNVWVGFVILFTVAMVSRFVSLYYLNKMYEPPYTVQKEDYFSLRQYTKKLPKTNYGKFVIYLCLLTFSTQIAAPFFAVFMLRDLNFSYLTYTILISAAGVSTFMSMVYWGKNIDEFGNRNVLTVCGYIVSIVPLLWLVSQSPYYLIFVQMLAGFSWAGFNLAAFNFLFDTVRPSKRSRCVAFQNVLLGFSIFFGAGLGGSLTKFITRPTFLVSELQVLFIMSALFRLFFSLVFLPQIKEVKPVTDVETKSLFLNLVAIRPVKGLRYQAISSANKTVGVFKNSIEATKKLESKGLELTKKLKKRPRKLKFKIKKK